MIERKIETALEERFQEEDLKTCFLVDIRIREPAKLEVYVDADDQLTIDMCRKISRHLERCIEEGGWLPERYTLDVSSPGIDNPLKLHRQYVKNVGRYAAVKCHDESTITGQITQVDKDHLMIVNDKKETINIPFDKIGETKILVRFK